MTEVIPRKDDIHNYTFLIKKPKKLDDNYEGLWVWKENGKGKQVLVRRESK